MRSEYGQSFLWPFSHPGPLGRLNINGQVDNNFRQNLERDVIQYFIRGLRPELEIRVVEKDTFKEVINATIDT